MDASGKSVVVLPEFGFFDPLTDCLGGWLSYLELDWPRGLLLHHGGARRHVFTMPNVAHPHLDQVAGSQLAFQPKIEHGEFTDPILKLEADAYGPNLFQFER